MVPTVLGGGVVNLYSQPLISFQVDSSVWDLFMLFVASYL